MPSSPAHYPIARCMKASNNGTVKAVMPWAGLHTMPLRIDPLRNGPVRFTFNPIASLAYALACSTRSSRSSMLLSAGTR